MLSDYNVWQESMLQLAPRLKRCIQILVKTWTGETIALEVRDDIFLLLYSLLAGATDARVTSNLVHFIVRWGLEPLSA